MLARRIRRDVRERGRDVEGILDQVRDSKATEIFIYLTSGRYGPLVFAVREKGV
jgi:uridine kinase